MVKHGNGTPEPDVIMLPSEDWRFSAQILTSSAVVEEPGHVTVEPWQHPALLCTQLERKEYSDTLEITCSP